MTALERTAPAIRYAFGHDHSRSWLLPAGNGCTLGRQGDRLLPLHDSGGSAGCCRMWHSGRSLVVEKDDPAVELDYNGASFERAELPLDGQFRLAGEVVRYHRARRTRPHELLPGMIGKAASMVELARLTERAAQFRVPALILGESGSGKELVARALHKLGPRASGPFVAVNAAMLTDNLGSSALFGHIRGAFTGAERARAGAFRRARGGTLFLDEVAELSPILQARLLRVIELRKVVAVGGDEEDEIDVRLVAATCRPLAEMVREHRFRHDLLQRLSAHKLHIPPLRKRRCDIPLIAARLLSLPEMRGYRLAEDALAPLVYHPFAGNVRELRNLLTQAMLYVDGERLISASAIRRALGQDAPEQPSLPENDIYQLWLAADRNISKAARSAGMPRSTFKDKLKRAREQLAAPPAPESCAAGDEAEAGPFVA